MMKEKMFSFKVNEKTYNMLKELSEEKDTSMTAILIEGIRKSYEEMRRKDDDRF